MIIDLIFVTFIIVNINLLLNLKKKIEKKAIDAKLKTWYGKGTTVCRSCIIQDVVKDIII